MEKGHDRCRQGGEGARVGGTTFWGGGSWVRMAERGEDRVGVSVTTAAVAARPGIA